MAQDRAVSAWNLVKEWNLLKESRDWVIGKKLGAKKGTSSINIKAMVRPWRYRIYVRGVRESRRRHRLQGSESRLHSR